MKCIRCGTETGGKQRICFSCLNSWSNMRLRAWEWIQDKHGELSQANLPIFQKEIRRLERIWRKDRAAFELEIRP